MKISIVTISFNQRVYLKEAIDSVLNQDYDELEYIVVDPGSTDGSRELIQSYGDRIAHVIFEPDKGAADGLNKGFAVASGDIFGFLNSDDLLMPGSLRKVAEFFQQHPECEMAMGDGHKIDAEGNRTKEIFARDFSVRRYLHGGSRWIQQSTFFRREAYLRSPGFNLENRTCWDGELFVNIASQGAKIGYIHADLSAFRIHGTSISGTGRMAEMYQKDVDRIFRDFQGRKWGPIDGLWRFFYRVEGVFKHAGMRMRISTKRTAL